MSVTNRNDDPRQGLIKIVDLYSAVYGLEILGQGILSTVDLCTDDKVVGAKAEVSQVIEGALDAFINKFAKKEEYERELESTLDGVWKSPIRDVEWVRGLITAAVVIRGQIIDNLVKAVYNHQTSKSKERDEAVAATMKLLANKEYSKYFSRRDKQDPFLMQVRMYAASMGGIVELKVLNSISLGTELHEAAALGDLDAAKQLVAEGVDINAKDIDGDTPLLFAYRCGHTKIIRFLMAALREKVLVVDKDMVQLALKETIKAGQFEAAKVVRQYNATYDPNWLLEFAREDNTEALETLLKLGVDVNYQNEKGITALHNACHHGKIKAVELLLRKGANQDLTTIDSNNTPMDWARTGGNNNVIKLLEVGKTGKNNYLLHKSIINGDSETAKKLIEAKVNLDVNARNEDRWTPVMMACAMAQPEVLKLLIDAKADLNLQNNEGVTALMLVCANPEMPKEKAVESVKLLIEGGANLTLERNNSSALEMAKKCNNLELVELIRNKLGENLFEPAKSGDFKKAAHLIDNGANTNFQKPDGSTALHIAAYNGHLEIVDGLLSPGNANPNLARKDGRTPLHFACLGGREKVVERLLACTAIDLTLKTVGGNTALDFAKDNKHQTIVKMLEARSRAVSTSSFVRNEVARSAQSAGSQSR